MYLIEESLFFNQFPFHKQKIAFHRASMKAYEAFLKEQGYTVHYIPATDARSDVRELLPKLKEEGITTVSYIDPTDDWLQQRITKACSRLKLDTTVYENPLFLNSKEEIHTYFKDRKQYHQTHFYKSERKRLGLLLTSEGEPQGGRWTYDTENRKKYPAKKTPPPVAFPDATDVYKEAKDYVATHFSENIGNLSDTPRYPYTFETASDWLDAFLEQRFHAFGPYEDAIVSDAVILHHSVLTPMLNVGLLTPHEVIDRALAFAEAHDVPINSTEGFVRQIMGWREFMRGMYEHKGSFARTRNFWNFNRPIPPSFYDGTTGIPPVDLTIQKVLDTGYCHHIERLMVLGNFMLLCEFDPDAVYRWFMEFFIDAYDWVMVPNVYGMSQFADGGLFATKPYISGSNYLMKMSNYKKGSWQEVWDGLFWRYMHEHRDFFESQPRLGMLLSTLDRMDPDTRKGHLEKAAAFLEGLDQELKKADGNTTGR